jgi:hypothetical protein
MNKKDMDTTHKTFDAFCAGIEVGEMIGSIPPSADIYHVTKKELYNLIDITWNEATESTTVPSYDWSDKIIAKWLHGTEINPVTPKPPR